MKRIIFLLLFLIVGNVINSFAEIITGDRRTELYLPLLKGKAVGVYSNATGMAGDKHVVDLLLEKGVSVKAIFAPEHGFRIKADAGEHFGNEKDETTGIDIISLYGSANKKPLTELVRPYDVIVVDIQDVGLRFYTYYVTMKKIMSACAKENKHVVVMDRPNPNGFYVDGPILDMKFKSGVGALPIPVVHGMTLGELALMMNGEKWLDDGLASQLTVIPCENYTHQSRYVLPIAPSPNLPNMKSIYLYPSICYFEGTVVSLGRGTEAPFQMYGHPLMKGRTFSFTPQSMPGAKNPPCLGQKCYGVDLRQLSDRKIQKEGLNLEYLIDAYHGTGLGDKFFTRFFELLIGVDYVRPMIEAGKTAKEIKACWRDDVRRFKKQRKPYLLYKE